MAEDGTRAAKGGLTRRALLLGAGGAAAATVAGIGLGRAASLESMIGQLLLVGFPGPETGDVWPARLVAQLAKGQASGVVFLRHNVTSRKAVSAVAQRFRRSGAPLTPLVAVDQEGGAVQRLSSKLGYADIPRAKIIAASMSPAQAKDVYAKAAREMAASHFNFNFAPVVDLDLVDGNPVVGKWGRGFGRDPQMVAAYAAAFIEAFRNQGIVCAPKHFPGHGSSRADTHDGFVDITRSWSKTELAPFSALIRSGHAEAVMTGHLYHADFADTREPMTFSRQAVQGVLRGQLGFDGVVVTDDLDMGAIRNQTPAAKAAVRAIAAGHDLVLLSNSAKPDPDLPARVIDAVVAAIETGALPRGRIEEAYRRVARLKSRLG
jgi:beta-N-acetylhexosaminidase